MEIRATAGSRTLLALDLTPARWGSLAQGRVLGSLSRTAVAEKTRRASRRTAQTFKIIQLQSEKDVCPCVFRC